MSLAALPTPPPLDAKQALRLRRFGLAALSCVLAAALVAVVWAFGVLPASAALEVAAAFFALNLGLYLVIRSEFNLRFDDPSLTRFQILAAITVLMYIVYHMDDGRNIALFGCFFVFLFGIFRLDAREFCGDIRSPTKEFTSSQTASPTTSRSNFCRMSETAGRSWAVLG